MRRSLGPRAAVLCAAIAAASLGRTGAIDNGLGITPPRGWRSWNLFRGNINTSVMEGQMKAVLDKSRSVGGVHPWRSESTQRATGGRVAVWWCTWGHARA